MYKRQGQALGLEAAGFEPVALVEIEPPACRTLSLNRPQWNVIHDDVKNFSAAQYYGVDLLAGGVPCPPFSMAGKQLGAGDERDLFPEALRLIDESRPTAVMLENVRGFLDAKFDAYRANLREQLNRMGYFVEWKILTAADFGVSQLRPRMVLIAIKQEHREHFSWPQSLIQPPKTVGKLLFDLMYEHTWHGALDWSAKANAIAPTIVGGSKKHGGPDLGPTRARLAWSELGVDGRGIADSAPAEDFVGVPRLTTRMVARLQGFPDEGQFFGKKTAAYRQIGNAFPPPVAAAVSRQLSACIRRSRRVYTVGIPA